MAPLEPATISVTASDGVELAGRRTRVVVALWRVALRGADWLGRIGRWVFVDARAVTMLALLAPAIVLWIRDDREAAGVAAALWFLSLLSLAAVHARDRLIVGDFAHTGGGSDGDNATTPTVDLGNLLLVELSRLGDLFDVVGGRRAVSSGLGQQRALDATLTVDDLVNTLQGTISADTKASFGPLTIPLAPLVALFGRLLQAPRLSGNLHRDGDVLILTAQTSRRGGLSWRVELTAPPLPDSQSATARAGVSAMVEELALRVYTDLALGRAVRWEASQSFVDGLRNFRSCLRTPKDRKVNLKRTEDLFLKALAEDEDFPLVYYNLGVVYTELHGLAVTAGRNEEARMHLSAAESSFGRAIERDPGRWEGYFAFAQTQFRYERYDSVIGLCAHILELCPGWADRAKTRELWARALVQRDRDSDSHKAVDQARRASRLALWSLLRARLWRQPSPRAEDDPESRRAALAASCLLTFTDIYSRQMRPAGALAPGTVRRWHQERIRRRVQALTKLAPLPHGKAQLHYDFGMRALHGGHLELAEQELATSARIDPTRPSYSAGLALARATHLTEAGRALEEIERDEIVALCMRALQGLAGAFFPARDARACEMLADVYARMGDAAHDDQTTAKQLRAVAEAVTRRLDDSVGGESVSGMFLVALQAEGGRLADRVGDYGRAAQMARADLLAGQECVQERRRDDALVKFRSALGAAERATSLNPVSTLAWETLGDVHRELSDFQNARSAWKQALGTDPDNPRLYDKIGSSYWHIAFEGRNRASDEDLEHAKKYFSGALTLYGSGSYKEQVLTHERLGKLNAVMRNFEEARRHLEIVEAVARPPIVGWEHLGFAYLQLRNFSEAEYYFGRVVKETDELAQARPPDAIIGDRLDEQLWPLALIRGWGHLGLAMSYAERQGDLAKADAHVDAASAALDKLKLDEDDPSSDKRFPTRAPAAVWECRGLILLRKEEIEQAIAALQQAVSMFPHSRSYLELALALEQRAMRDTEARKRDVPRALQLLEHGVNLGPADEPTGEFLRALDRLTSLDGASRAA